MKNLLKSFLLAATAFVLLAGCNQIGLSDATVDGATYSEGHCYLTISVDDLADMAAVDRSAARTINPVSLQDDATERAKITAFVLSGTSESTGDTYSKEFAIADFEANSGNSEKMQTKEDKKVVIPYGLWEFTLVAKDIDGRELLQGKSFANLKTANSEVSFTLKTDGLTENGGVNLAGTFEDEGSVAKSYAAGLYDVVTGELVAGTSVIGDITAGTPAFAFNPKDGEDEYFILPGHYSFQVKFLNKALIAGTDGAKTLDSSATMVGLWEDTVVVAPGRITAPASISCGKIINQLPDSPSNLRAWYKNGSDSVDGYTVILTWDDNSNNEENFVITIEEFENTTAATGTTYKVLGVKDDADEKKEVFFASKMYAGGSVHASSKTASIKLPHGKLFEISIQAENFVGLSDADANTDGVQASVRITDALAANADLPDGVTADDTLFNAENGKINRYAINYDLDGGTLTLANGDVKKGTYTEYDNFYKFAADADLKLSTLLLKTNATTVIESLDGYAFEKWVNADGTEIADGAVLTFAGINVKADWDNKTLISYTIDNKYFTINTTVQYGEGSTFANVEDDTVDTTADGVAKNKDLKFTVTAVNDNATKTENTTLKIEKLSVKINNANTFLKAETIAAAPLTNSCTCTLSTKQLEGGYHTVIVTAVIDGKTYQNAFPLLYKR